MILNKRVTILEDKIAEMNDKISYLISLTKNNS